MNALTIVNILRLVFDDEGGRVVLRSNVNNGECPNGLIGEGGNE